MKAQRMRPSDSSSWTGEHKPHVVHPDALRLIELRLGPELRQWAEEDRQKSEARRLNRLRLQKARHDGQLRATANRLAARAMEMMNAPHAP